jgi:hypothetical protein
MADKEWVEMLIRRGVPLEELERRDAVQDRVLDAEEALRAATDDFATVVSRELEAWPEKEGDPTVEAARARLELERHWFDDAVREALELVGRADGS